MGRLAGRELSAKWSCEKTDDGWAVTLDSRSGARGTEIARNTDYREALALILALLGARSWVLTDIELSSKTAKRLEPGRTARRVNVQDVACPVILNTVDDYAVLGQAIQRALAPMFSTRTEPGGGNREKRITLHIEPSAETPAPHDLRDWLENGDAAPAAGDGPGPAFRGETYREEDEDVSINHKGHVEIDPANAERALAGHRRTQNALASFLRDRGLEPLSRAKGEPDFDLAWMDGAVLHVAEIKSINNQNEEGQLRLGLGQVLRYRHRLAKRHEGEVRAVLVPEREPKDAGWKSLCEELGVVLCWAPFAALNGAE